MLGVSSVWAQKTEYIYKKTKDGRTLKIPKKQYFKFRGSDVKGEVDRPFEADFGNRKMPRRRSLIPIRKSFRREAVEAAGFPRRLYRR